LIIPPEFLLTVPVAALAVALMRRCAVCWLLGHRVGPVVVARQARGTEAAIVRTSRCTRCGRVYSSTAAAPVRAGDEVEPAA
jgi:hypothetical protein